MPSVQGLQPFVSVSSLLFHEVQYPRGKGCYLSCLPCLLILLFWLSMSLQSFNATHSGANNNLPVKGDWRDWDSEGNVSSELGRWSKVPPLSFFEPEKGAGFWALWESALGYPLGPWGTIPL